MEIGAQKAGARKGGAGRIVLLAALGLAFGLPAAEPSKKDAEANLRQLNEQIQRIQRQTQQDTQNKGRITRNIRDADKAVARVQGDLTALRRQRDERSAARRQLVADREAREAERQRTHDDLVAQLRAAYMMGSNEPLKLLLNQRNPAEFRRNLTYYGYFGRLRASQIVSINENIVKIDELTAKIDEEDAELARLEGAQKEKQGELQAARKEQDRALSELEREMRSRSAQLKKLQDDKKDLEQLIRRLSQATQGAPYDPKAPFAAARGRLPWPVAGKIVVNYGQTPAGGIRSDGIDMDATRGASVRALHEGKVIFADFLTGRGLVVVLDHGNHYYSLYAHNETLFVEPDARVASGAVIATVGSSGGRKRPGLYFEIRQGRNTQPIDPRIWLRTRTPPAG